jgi:membrane protease YdiL (CAAX protease family)
VAFIICRKEHLGWDSVGLQRPAIGKTTLWVLLTIVGAALAVALAFGLIKLFKLPMGSSDSAKYDLLPTWVLLVTLVKAGFIEEFFYRGYAIERLQSLTGRRFLAVAVPLFLFAIFHYRQGWAGIIVALLSGAVLTGVYLLKHNLWVNITAHFLADFIPNIVVPLFMAK